jgi:phosphoribosyl 1,2-cyclic phosphate phosphodiesterase
VAIPRKGCRCTTCTHARKPKSKSKRTRSSVIISKRGFNLLIDCSPDFLEQTERERIKKIDAVLLTHLHADAAGGLKKLNKWTKKKVPVYTERSNFKRIKHLNNLDLKEVKLGRVKLIGPFRVTAYRVRHGLTPGFPTVGYRIDKKFGYISDVGEIPKNNLKYFKNLKLLFLDGAIWLSRRMRGHLNVWEAIELSRVLKAKKTVLTQIGHGYPVHHQAVREINKIDRRVGLAYDGMKLKI